jgi:hypothetical protein
VLSGISIDAPVLRFFMTDFSFATTRVLLCKMSPKIYIEKGSQHISYIQTRANSWTKLGRRIAESEMKSLKLSRFKLRIVIDGSYYTIVFCYLPSSDNQKISASFEERLSFYKDSSYYPIR